MYHEMGLGEIGHLLSCARDEKFIVGYAPDVELTRTTTQDIDQTGLVDIAVDDLGAQLYCRQQSSELTGSMRELVLLFDNKFT
jgi:hypothetical protein